MEDYDFHDDECPSCRHHPTHIRDCDQMGCEEGYIDVSEEDYLEEGTNYIKCRECNGTGIQHWCPKCGHDLK